MTKSLLFYLNGQFLPEDKAKISVTDLGLVRGYAVFDFLRTYNGRPFKLSEHLQRLKKSAEIIQLSLPWTIEELRKLVIATFQKNSLKDACIKIIITGGVSPNQILPVGQPTLAILVYPIVVYPKSFYRNGIKVITVAHHRVVPMAKTTDYADAVASLIKARKQQAIEALYTNEKKQILEATTSNFFAFKDNFLITPKDDILLGITRQLVIELAAKEFKVKLRPIKYSEVKDIDEAFITATNKEVMPVVQINNQKVGNGKVGEKTKKVMRLFKEYTLKYA